MGGISTEAGGDVTITAGGNVTSYLPGSSDTCDDGTGAFGAKKGDVTIVAGGNVTGHYVLANGTGAIYAGVNMLNGIPWMPMATPSRTAKVMFWHPVRRAAPGRRITYWR